MLVILMQIEGDILLYIQNFIRNPILTPFFQFITTLGNHGMIWAAISVCMLFFKKTRKAGILSLLALGSTLLINNMILKNLFARTRPFDMIVGLQVLIVKPADYSFPSGHTASSFASAYIIVRCLPSKYGTIAIVLAALIGVSRLYVGVHYLTDIIGGAVLGIIIAELIYKAYFTLKEKGKKEESAYGRSM